MLLWNPKSNDLEGNSNEKGSEQEGRRAQDGQQFGGELGGELHRK